LGTRFEPAIVLFALRGSPAHWGSGEGCNACSRVQTDSLKPQLLICNLGRRMTVRHCYGHMTFPRQANREEVGIEKRRVLFASAVILFTAFLRPFISRGGQGLQFGRALRLDHQLVSRLVVVCQLRRYRRDCCHSHLLGHDPRGRLIRHTNLNAGRCSAAPGCEDPLIKTGSLIWGKARGR
jgi:hypothetical protein